MKQFLFVAAVVASASLSVSNARSADSDATARTQAVMPREHQAVFRKYCLDCHDSATQEGKIDLETIPFEIARDIPTAERWAKILNAINSGEMPPKDSEPISDEDKTAFLGDLSTRMVVARKILSDTGGVITMRRLNRREYQNTIEALLGIRPDVSPLPDDQANSGFDTSGASLFFSSDQLEQYLAVARRSLQLALNPQTAKARTVRVEPEELATPLYREVLIDRQDALKRARAFRAQSKKPASAFGFIDKGQAAKQLRSTQQVIPQLVAYFERPETKHGATLISTIKQGITKVIFRPLDGEAGKNMLIRVRAGAYDDASPRYRYLEFTMRSWSNGYTKQLGWRKVKGTIENPEIIEFPVSVPAGERVQFYVHQRTHQGRGDKNLWTLHRETNPIGTPPGLWVDWGELVRSGHDGQLSEAAAKVYFSVPDGWDEERYAKEVISRFARRAFRTEQPAKEYVAKLFDRFSTQRASGLGVHAALIEPLAIVLASPSFLYMVESTGGEESLTELELAVRLSYFLWSAPPDEALLAEARSGRLTDPKVLRAQTSRMLADSRADRFVRGFVHQWLGMERLGMFQFQAELYPTFDNGARESAREEVYQTVHTMLDEKLPLRTLLKADFVVVNDLLADYYELNGVEGPEFRKVSLPADSPRGGLLGSAAVLAMGSDGNRTSPVERGAWVLRHLLNDPPPPAPPNVPQLSRLAGKVLSARALQQAHQEQPQCAQCHRKIDPIGYGLENFNAAGRWRDVELVPTGKRREKPKQFPIDPSGQLANGKQFSGYNGLRDAVADQVDGFARGLTESLIAYGLGRPYGFTDQDLADEIVKEASSEEYELSLFVHGLVQSQQFKSK